MICANKVDRRAAAVAEGVRCVRTEDGERLASVCIIFRIDSFAYLIMLVANSNYAVTV